jgi:hypothetical protein
VSVLEELIEERKGEKSKQAYPRDRNRVGRFVKAFGFVYVFVFMFV